MRARLLRGQGAHTRRFRRPKRTKQLPTPKEVSSAALFLRLCHVPLWVLFRGRFVMTGHMFLSFCHVPLINVFCCRRREWANRRRRDSGNTGGFRATCKQANKQAIPPANKPTHQQTNTPTNRQSDTLISSGKRNVALIEAGIPLQHLGARNTKKTHCDFPFQAYVVLTKLRGSRTRARCSKPRRKGSGVPSKRHARTPVESRGLAQFVLKRPERPGRQ